MMLLVSGTEEAMEVLCSLVVAFDPILLLERKYFRKLEMNAEEDLMPPPKTTVIFSLIFYLV